jgi:hypothetical protein
VQHHEGVALSAPADIMSTLAVAGFVAAVVILPAWRAYFLKKREIHVEER